MDSEATTRSPGRRYAAWTVRALFIAAAAGAVAWLFLLYQPPERRTYPGRQKVVFWHMWTANWAEVVQKIVDRFNESQDRYEVVPLTVAGGSLKTLIATAGGGPPDCMAQWESVIPAWADRNALTPLDELMDPKEWADLRDHMYPAVRAIGTYKGHFYGLSTGMNMWAIYYRPSHFREAGLDPDRFPRTLEELDEVAAKLYQFDKAGRITRIGFMPRVLVHYIALFGGALYDEQAGRLTLTHPRNVAALDYMAGYGRKYGYDRVISFEAGLTTTFAASWPFISGAYSMVVDGQWRVEQLARFAPDLDYRTAPLPPPAGGKPLACWSNGNFMIIPRGARNKAGALAFMKFWSGVDKPERAAEFYTWGGWLPITPDVARAPLYQEYIKKYPEFKTFVDILASPNVQVSPPVPHQAYVMQRVGWGGWAEEAALRGTVTPREALQRVADDCDRELRTIRVADRQEGAP
jgi:multiple sugar transport system substrate-binding protein